MYAVSIFKENLIVYCVPSIQTAFGKSVIIGNGILFTDSNHSIVVVLETVTVGVVLICDLLNLVSNHKAHRLSHKIIQTVTEDGFQSTTDSSGVQFSVKVIIIEGAEGVGCPVVIDAAIEAVKIRILWQIGQIVNHRMPAVTAFCNQFCTTYRLVIISAADFFRNQFRIAALISRTTANGLLSSAIRIMLEEFLAP